MSSISDLIIRVNPTSDGIAQAESWSRKALDVTNDTRDKLRYESSKWFSKTPTTDPVCEFALAVSLYNIGVLRAVIIIQPTFPPVVVNQCFIDGQG